MISGDAPRTLICPSCAAEYGPETRFCPRDGAVLKPKTPTGDLTGQIIGGRYRVERKLGQGGMGTVYLAEHCRMGRRCALKVLSRALSEDAESASRFAREAANASRVTHANVATVYDFGETDDGLVYLAMEYVEGEPLSRVLKREGRLPAERAVGIACQIAAGLVCAHRAGLVHRDLKPDNVLVARGEDGGDLVKVIDFGIAKAAHEEGQDLTRTGFVLGTPRYMSPEQLMGEPADARSDLYSLGCIVYQMLVGQDPWGGATPTALTRRLTEAAPHPRAADARLPEALDEAVVRLLSRSPEERFQSAEETSAALARAVGWAPPPGSTGTRPIPAATRPIPTAVHSPPSPAPTGPVAGEERPVAEAGPAAPGRPRGMRAPLRIAAVLVALVAGGSAAFVYFGERGGAVRRTGESAAAPAGPAARAPGAPGPGTPASGGATPGPSTPLASAAVTPTDAGSSASNAPAPPPDAAGPPASPATANPADGRQAGSGPAPAAATSPGNASAKPAGAAEAGVAPEIGPLIDRFVRALQSRDLERIKRIDAEADGTDRWWTFISAPDIADLRVESRTLTGPDVQGDEGSAVVEVTFHYRSGGADAARPWPMRITFGRDPDGWRIRTVRTLQ